jgi:hypothetical protein
MSKWIKADAVNVEIGGGYIDIDAESFLNAPSIDICFCRECKWWNCEMSGCKRNPSVVAWRDDDFCSYGCRDTEKPNNLSEIPTGSERSSE